MLRRPKSSVTCASTTWLAGRARTSVAADLYGVEKDLTLGAACHVQHRTRIPNVLLTGQNVNSHGMLGTLVGTMVTCSDIIGTERLYAEIRDAGHE